MPRSNIPRKRNFAYEVNEHISAKSLHINELQPHIEIRVSEARLITGGVWWVRKRIIATNHAVKTCGDIFRYPIEGLHMRAGNECWNGDRRGLESLPAHTGAAIFAAIMIRAQASASERAS